jgi:hypothetical protein
MGFDVYGKSARSEKGEYFRNNVWWWRPLAEYVLETVEMPRKSKRTGIVIAARRCRQRLHPG